jgi:hypothetical protein
LLADPAVLVEATPVPVRRWNARPFPALTNIDACAESALSEFRIMTPVLVHGSALSTAATLAVIEPSPVSVV